MGKEWDHEKEMSANILHSEGSGGVTDDEDLSDVMDIIQNSEDEVGRAEEEIEEEN